MSKIITRLDQIKEDCDITVTNIQNRDLLTVRAYHRPTRLVEENYVSLRIDNDGLECAKEEAVLGVYRALYFLNEYWRNKIDHIEPLLDEENG